MARIRIISLVIFLSSFLAYSAFAELRLGQDGERINGFFEVLFGPKLGHDITKRDDYNVLEERLQLKTRIYPESSQLLKDWLAELNLKGDFTLDQYYSNKTGFDLREANFAVTPLNWMDLKVGRQVFTWGSGDYLFLNDLFPKDYVSFYIGRDDEYLKKPSDGIRLSLYSQLVNFNLAVIPSFEPNTIFQGDRLSFFDPFQGGIAGRNSERRLVEPPHQPNNTEFATRLYRNFGSYELALYTFRGFYKMPLGYLNEANRELFYPRLDAYGFSLRGPTAGGIGNIEYSFYNSRQDKSGNNRLIENSMQKFLIGYSKDLGNDLSIGTQYLYEQILNYSNYKQTLLTQDFRWDQYRHLTTFRITKLFKSQTVKVNVFSFFSPSDMDFYLRPSLDYDLNDNFKLTLGANLIWGRDDHTEFGQMEHNKNIYIRARYSF